MSKRLAYLADSQVIDYFLDSKTAQGLTPDSLFYYRYNLNLFRAYLKKQEIPLLEADQFAITGFLAMRTKEVSSSTLHIYWRVLRAFYNWCVHQEFRLDNPVSKVPEPKIPHKIIPILREDQLNNMLDVCGFTEYLKARNYAILLVMLDTGIRRSEVVAMRLQDIDWKNRTIKIHGKGRKERLVKVSIDTMLAMRKYQLYRELKKKDEYTEVWLTEEGAPMHSRGIQAFFRRLKDRAGITDVRCSAHTMRHTFACSLIRNGASVKTTQDLLGHADISTTEIYAVQVLSEKSLFEHEIASPVSHLKRRK